MLPKVIAAAQSEQANVPARLGIGTRQDPNAA